jgi:hypothetical protein
MIKRWMGSDGWYINSEESDKAEGGRSTQVWGKLSEPRTGVATCHDSNLGLSGSSICRSCLLSTACKTCDQHDDCYTTGTPSHSGI